MTEAEFDAFVSTLLTSDEEVQIEANALEGFITDQTITGEVAVDNHLERVAEYEEWERRYPNRFEKHYPGTD